ncbi:MAG TPA: TonB-dependent receptor [Steroidobacteraceae bacterium]|nr:TonB-dependent receptor [Steroidobacteraceae bacterium]
MAKTKCGSLVLSILMLVHASAWAQGDSTAATAAQNQSATLQEVVVTAQKRSERLQDVPIAVTALTAERLATAGVESTTDLPLVTPGLTFVNISGNAFPHIRGIGTTAIGAGFENPVSLYVDGVYFASGAASLLTLNNVAQVEVLKGPQGTLFGRNATGGLIQVTTRDPQQVFGGEVNLGYGNYGTAVVGGYLTGPLSEQLAGDLAVRVSTQGQGYGTNLFNGKDVYRADRDVAIRSKWGWTPWGGTALSLIVDYEENAGSQDTSFSNAPGTAPLFGPPGPVGNWDIAADFQPRNLFRGGGASIRLQQDMGFAQLTNITAYRRSQTTLGFDGDGVTEPIQTLDPVKVDDLQVTEELQLTSTGSGRLQWVAGVFYIHGDSKSNPSTVALGGPLLNFAVPPTSPFFQPFDRLSIYGDQTTDSWAGYGQSTLALTDSDHLTLGVRYTTEHRHLAASELAQFAPAVPFFGGTTIDALTPPIDEGKTFARPTWRVAVDHRFSDEVLGYLSYNRGFKSGGFNPGVPTDPAYNPEVLDAYEVGLKSDLWDRRVRLNAAAFYYDYKNIQVGHFVLGQIGYYNGAAAEIYGLDADFEALITPQLTFTAGVALLHDRFTDFPNAVIFTPQSFGGNATSTGSANGNRLPLAPDATLNVSLDYRRALPVGELGLDISDSYSHGYVFAPDNILHQPAFNLVNASMSWTAPGERFTASLWGKNLSNEVVANALLASAIGSLASYRPPRTFGASVSVKF